MRMEIDRRALLAGAAAIGVVRPAAAEPDGLARLIEMARARAASPFVPSAALPALRVGQAMFCADAIRAAGDPGCFGIAAGLCAVADERPAFVHLRREGDAVLALLDCPSLAAAARFRLAAAGRAMRVEAQLFFRRPVEELALAPCSALVEAPSPTGAAVQEAAALTVSAGTGAPTRRTLEAPDGARTRDFPAERLRGFGLLAPAGDGRPSLFVTPAHDWGDGAVRLAAAPSADETVDNVRLAFVRRRTFAAGDGFAYRYALDWTTAIAAGMSPATS